MNKKKTTIRYLLGLVTFLLISQVAIAQNKEQEAHKRKWDTPAWTDTMRNPYAHDAAATDSAKKLYQVYCSVCHGTKGKGDGVAAAGLSIKPADHTSNNVQLQTDGSLFYELSNGHAPMPGFKTTLTEKQRWSLINYIRTLKPQPKTKT